METLQGRGAKKLVLLNFVFWIHHHIILSEVRRLKEHLKIHLILSCKTKLSFYHPTLVNLNDVLLTQTRNIWKKKLIKIRSICVICICLSKDSSHWFTPFNAKYCHIGLPSLCSLLLLFLSEKIFVTLVD